MSSSYDELHLLIAAHSTLEWVLHPLHLSLALSVVLFSAEYLTPLQSKLALGWLGDSLSVVMYSGPLAAVGAVIRERSTKAFSFPFTCAMAVNCSLWFLHGAFVMGDPFIYTPGLYVRLLMCVPVRGGAERGAIDR